MCPPAGYADRALETISRSYVGLHELVERCDNAGVRLAAVPRNQVRERFQLKWRSINDRLLNAVAYISLGHVVALVGRFRSRARAGLPSRARGYSLRMAFTGSTRAAPRAGM